MTAENRFFEIVNWKKAQPRMKGGGNDWMKLYTSLLDHDGFAGLDDSARILLISLWLYAARSGLHIFPADPDWISKKIPILNSKPDLGPLINATDCYSNPTPFICFCEPPKAKKSKKRQMKKGKTKNQEDQSRIEESREESREENRVEEQTKPLRVSEEKKEQKKERISKTKAEATKIPESEKPANPTESDAGSAKKHILLKPTRSAIRKNNPQSIGFIINEWLPDHWQDPDAESFGWEIIQALGYPNDLQSLKIRSEWGAFASWWSKIKKSAPPMILNELKTKALNKANYLRIKGKSAKNRSAVWFYIMEGELSKHGIHINGPIRASPL